MYQGPGPFPPPPETNDSGPFATSPSPGQGFGYPPGYGFYPLNVGRIFSLSWSLYRYRFLTFTGIALVSWLPGVIVTGLVAAATTGRMLEWQQSLTSALQPGGPIDTPIAAFPWDVLLWTFAAGMVTGLVAYLGSAAVIHAAEASFSGRFADFRSATRFALGNAGRIVGLYVAIALLVGGLPLLGSALPALFLSGMSGTGMGGLVLVPLLALVIGIAVLFILIRLQLVLQALVVEGKGPLESIRRSWSLVGGSMWRMLGYQLLFGLVIGLPAAIAGTIALFLSRPAFVNGVFTYNATSIFIQAAVSGIISAVLTPLLMIALTVLYMDIRWRRGEGVPVPGNAAAPR